MATKFIGSVYIVCLDSVYQTGKSQPVAHYIGFANQVAARLEHHRAGNGSKL